MSVVLLAVEVDGALLNQGFHDSQVLPQVGEGLSEVEAVGFVHLGQVTGPDPEPEAARGQVGEHVGLLGGGDRVSGPGGDDGRAEEYGLGAHRRGGEQGDGVGVPAGGRPCGLDA